ncbi:MAG: caspase family protein [Rhizobacter sp.]
MLRRCAPPLVALLLAACGSTPSQAPGNLSEEQLMIVDCLLPGQVRQLGSFATSMSARRPQKLPAHECAQAGGEFALATRDPARALAIWLPFAQQGQAEAQTQVGEMYERGIGTVADPATAATWYGKAAQQGDSRALINLASLHERGLGVKRDPALAARLFRQASGQGGVPGRITIDLVDPVIVVPTPGQDGAAPIVNLSGQGERREIRGKVSSDAGVRQLMFNNKPLTVDSQGLFRAEISLPQGGSDARFTATDRQGVQASLNFRAVPSGATPIAPKLNHGLPNARYHALVIANQGYRHWPKLNNPVNDAQDIKRMLEQRYDFQVTMLVDSTRRDLFAAFNALRTKLKPEDNLLVFYAGHGDIEESTQRGYWVPVDGEKDNRSNWISVVDVTDQINALGVRQVLVIADSCYSGTMARTALPVADADLVGERHWDALRAISQLRARVALTSGGLEPVVDGGAGRNSLFASSLLDVLGAVNEPIETRRMFDALSARFSLRAQRLKVQQKPQYAPIRFAGHEAGDFIFVPKR